MGEISFSFSGTISTSQNGINKLADFYKYCVNYADYKIKISFADVLFFDANLCALLLALSKKLNVENNVSFYTDEAFIDNSYLSVLYRNGFINDFFGLKDELIDDRKSVIPIKYFDVYDADGFATYIEGDLLTHRGLSRIDANQKDKLKNSYFEIFDNVGIHSQTNYPVFACGQFFPQLRELKFTVVDLGNGFLTKIMKYTKDTSEPISNIESAIKWAILGGSTKSDAQGGTGLMKILTYCLTNNGAIHICSDGCYWVFDKKINTYKINFPLTGASISLVFRNL